MPDAMKPNEYRCAACRGVFTKICSEAEVEAELRELHGDYALEECDTVCDDCWQKLICPGCDRPAPQGHEDWCDLRRRERAS